MKKLILILFVGLLIMGCEKDEAVVNYDDVQIETRGNKAGKVDVCHVLPNGNINVLNINENALQAHLDHGDYLPDAYYEDGDGDEFGNPETEAVMSCEQPEGYVLDNTDCNDGDATVYPGAEELCNDGVDNDCDGEVDEDCCPDFVDDRGTTYNVCELIDVIIEGNSSNRWRCFFGGPANGEASYINITYSGGRLYLILSKNGMVRFIINGHIEGEYISHNLYYTPPPGMYTEFEKISQYVRDEVSPLGWDNEHANYCATSPSLYICCE